MTRYTDALTTQHKLANDMLIHANRYAEALIAWDTEVLHQTSTNEQLGHVLRGIYDMVRDGDTYFMSSTIEQGLIQAAHALPSDCQVHREAFPSIMGFLLLEEPLPSIISDTPGLGTITAFSWWYTNLDDGLDAAVVIGWWQSQHMLKPALYLKVQNGDTVDQILDLHRDPLTEEDAPILNVVKFLIATFNFLEQQLLEPAREAAPRQQRRQLQSKGHAKSTAVNVIRLRRRYVQHPTDPNRAPIEHEFQWAVRGHWRKQPYPSKGPDYYKHIYISPYVKGPEDKPLKGTERVYAIVR